MRDTPNLICINHTEANLDKPILHSKNKNLVLGNAIPWVEN